MNKIAIGLDIGRTCIKIVRLGLKGREVELIDFESSEISHSFKSYDINDIIEKIFLNKKIKLNTPVCLSLCAEDSFFEILKLSPKQKSNFKTIIYDELRSNVAFSFDDCIWDYCYLDSEFKVKDTILLATAKKESLHQRLQLVQESGCVPKLINLDVLAAYNCLRFNHELSPDKLYALLDISASRTQLLIFTLGGEFWIRSIPFGGQRFFLKIASERGLTPQEAQEFIKNLYLQKEEQMQTKELLWSLLEEYTFLLKKYFEEYYFQSSNAATKNEIVHKIDQIWISGGGSLFKGIDELIYNSLHIPVQYINSFKQFKTRENNHKLTNDTLTIKAPMFATAVGLALQGLHCADIKIDFIKTNTIKNIKRIIKNLPWRRIIRFSLFIIMATMLIFGIWKFTMLATKDNYFEKKIIAVKEYINVAILKKSEKRKELKQWASITKDSSKNLLATQNTFSQLFIRISKSLPRGTEIDNVSANFDYKEGKAKVVLTGRAINIASLQKLVSRLEDTHWFTAIEHEQLVNSGIKTDTSSDKEPIYFSVRLELDLEK